MALIHETDYGTPSRASETLVTLEIDGKTCYRARRHFCHARSGEHRCRGTQAMRHRQPRGVRVLPAVPGRGRRTSRHARFLLYSGRTRHEGANLFAKTFEAAARNDGAVHFRSSSGLPHLPARTGTASFRIWREWGDCARSVTVTTARIISKKTSRQLESVFQFRAGQMHPLLTLRPGLRRSAGHFRPDHRRPRLRLNGFGRRQAVPGFGMRVLRGVCASLSYGDAH